MFSFAVIGFIIFGNFPAGIVNGVKPVAADEFFFQHAYLALKIVIAEVLGVFIKQGVINGYVVEDLIGGKEPAIIGEDVVLLALVACIQVTEVLFKPVVEREVFVAPVF